MAFILSLFHDLPRLSMTELLQVENPWDSVAQKWAFYL